MALQAGTTLGPYEIQAPLGAGGMGEVYKARDTRLDRTVAIKVLPEHLATDPDLKQRFEREAKAIAALSHPHICALHDIGNQDGIDFLVMEHLDGQTLAQRLENGALPLDDAIQIAIEIADALDKAHRQGIVHRDLKPGNIMLTKSGAKLLDFGLAKLKTAGGMGAEGLTAQVTQSEPLTSQGSILGTLQYMAPEQLEGRNADARSDIFAFGAVVYEMVTGRKAFEGDSQASLIGAILHTVPPQVSAVHPEVARPLDRLVAKCLAKDPDRRWQTASDLVDDLRWISEAPDAEQTGDMPAPAKPAWRVLPWMLAAAAIVAGVLLGRAWFEGSTVAPVQELTRFTVDLDPGLRLSGGAPLEVAEFALQRPSRQSLLLSPDGRHLAYLASDGDKTRIYWRPMDQAQSVPLPGTEGPYEPFFSPGGTEVGFFNGFRFKRVSLESGEVRTITTSGLEGFSVGGSWTTADTIVLSTGEAVWEVPADGGTLNRLTAPGAGLHILYPELLPGAGALLFNVQTGLTTPPSEWNIVVYSLDTHDRKVVVEGGSDPRYVPSGHILFVRLGTLMAVPFDVERLEATGPPVAVLEDVLHAERGGHANLNTGAAQFSVSHSGTLAYAPGGIYPVNEHPLVWLDRSGTSEPLSLPPRAYLDPRFSPDGTRLVYMQGVEGDRQLWVYDIALETPTRLTAAGENLWPVWSPNGTRLAFTSRVEGRFPMFTMAADGSGEPQRITASDGGFEQPGSWSSDDVLAFVQGTDIWTVSMDGDGSPQPFVEDPFRTWWPAFSPDGRWLAYASDETGRPEVYVRPFPAGEPGYRISTAGGRSPVWSADGRQLFFRVVSERQVAEMMVVDVRTDAVFTRSQPRKLFESAAPRAAGLPGEFIRTVPSRAYDISPDGQRFVIPDEDHYEQQPATSINIVLNWTKELLERVPVN